MRWFQLSSYGFDMLTRKGVQEMNDAEALQELLSLWPFVNCACGRNKLRMPNDLRLRLEDMLAVLKKGKNADPR
jgi:hypothetical protein